MFPYNYTFGYIVFSIYSNIINRLELDAILIRSTPSYVSNWTPMTANSPTAKVTLRHDLQGRGTDREWVYISRVWIRPAG